MPSFRLWLVLFVALMSVGPAHRTAPAAEDTDRAARQSAPPMIEPGQARKFRGKAVTMCGRVVSYQCDSKQRHLRLDLDKPYWADAPGVLIDAASAGTFGRRLEDKYILAHICATGVVERIKRRDLVRVEQPEQIVVTKAPPRGPFAAAAVRLCDGNVAMPKVLKEVKPEYTMEAMRGIVQGRVFLDAQVMPDGSVGPIQLLVGFKPEWGLNEAAVRAVQQWKFQPGTVDGQPVPVVVSIELAFTLK